MAEIDPIMALLDSLFCRGKRSSPTQSRNDEGTRNSG